MPWVSLSQIYQSANSDVKSEMHHFYAIYSLRPIMLGLRTYTSKCQCECGSPELHVRNSRFRAYLGTLALSGY